MLTATLPFLKLTTSKKMIVTYLLDKDDNYFEVLKEDMEHCSKKISPTKLLDIRDINQKFHRVLTSPYSLKKIIENLLKFCSNPDFTSKFSDLILLITANEEFFKILFEIENERKAGGRSLYEFLLRNIERVFINYYWSGKVRVYTLRLSIEDGREPEDYGVGREVKTAEESEWFELETKATIDMNL